MLFSESFLGKLAYGHLKLFWFVTINFVFYKKWNKMKQNETKLGEKRETKYYCKFCYYSCGVKFSYYRHALTWKHLKHTQNETNETNETKKRKKRKTFLIIFVTAGKGNIIY